MGPSRPVGLSMRIRSCRQETMSLLPRLDGLQDLLACVCVHPMRLPSPPGAQSPAVITG